jgi:ABC-type methionine transport system permease subunit
MIGAKRMIISTTKKIIVGSVMGKYAATIAISCAKIVFFSERNVNNVNKWFIK